MASLRSPFDDAEHMLLPDSSVVVVYMAEEARSLAAVQLDLAGAVRSSIVAHSKFETDHHMILLVEPDGSDIVGTPWCMYYLNKELPCSVGTISQQCQGVHFRRCIQRVSALCDSLYTTSWMTA